MSGGDGIRGSSGPRSGRAETFGDRLQAAVAAHGRLCVGIDPHASLLSAWGLPDDAAGARDFALRVVDAAAGRVGVVKPQVAFFERHGSAGFAALEAVLAAARDAGLLVIADAKRGDIGSTMDGYADAWLTPGSPLEADALTVSPYLGVGSLSSAMATAERHGKGLFVLAATSNPEAGETQLARAADGRVLAASIAAAVAARNPAEPAWGSFGVVIGATVDVATLGLDAPTVRTSPILAPGFGAQGVALRDLRRVFGDLAPRVLANVSRELLSVGPDGLRDAIDRARDDLDAAA